MRRSSGVCSWLVESSIIGDGQRRNRGYKIINEQVDAARNIHNTLKHAVGTVCIHCQDYNIISNSLHMATV